MQQFSAEQIIARKKANTKRTCRLLTHGRLAGICMMWDQTGPRWKHRISRQRVPLVRRQRLADATAALETPFANSTLKTSQEISRLRKEEC